MHQLCGFGIDRALQACLYQSGVSGQAQRWNEEHAGGVLVYPSQKSQPVRGAPVDLVFFPGVHKKRVPLAKFLARLRGALSTAGNQIGDPGVDLQHVRRHCNGGESRVIEREHEPGRT